MSEHLKTLLERAVPDDAPRLDPHLIAEAARRQRRRARVVAGSVMAAVAAAGIGVVALPGGEDPVAKEPAVSPYDAPACPATLPELSDAQTEVASLDGLTSVRLCLDLVTPGPESDAPLPADVRRAALDSMDALVDGIPAFADRLAVTGPFDAARCATMTVINSRQSLQLTYADGRSVLLPTALCSPITVADKAIDGSRLVEMYVATLDEQRDRFDYRPASLPALRCDQRLRANTPAHPGRERLVAGIHCPLTASGGPVTDQAALTDTQVAMLDEAWQSARTAPTTDDTSACTGTPGRPSFVLAMTDRGDVVQLTDAGCGTLLWSGWRSVDPQELPTSFEELGLTP